MKQVVYGVITAVALLAGEVFAAGPWYVAKEDPNASDAPCEGRGTEALPYRSIQAALDSASFEAGDTVYVKRGDYDEGEYPIESKTTSATNRVLITKKVILKALDGKAITRIVGKWGAGTDNGSGLGAVRCVCVNSTAAETVIEGFTFLDGCVKQQDNDQNRCGAGVYSRAGKSVYVIDCDFVNCSGNYGGGLYGGTAIRCRFNKCQAGGYGPAAAYAYLFSCVMENCWHSSGTVRYVIQDGCVALNCTIVHNKAPGLSAAGEAYNCVFAQNDYDNTKSGIQDIVGDAAVASNCTTTATATTYPDQVIGLAHGDYSLMAGTLAVDYGKTEYTNVLVSLGVPFDYLKYDFYGKEIDWSGATVHAGAVQTVKTPRADVAKVVFKEAAVVDGYQSHAGTWIYPDAWPVQYLVKPVVAAGKTFYCYTPTSGDKIFLQPNGEVRVTPPLASVTATQTYAQKSAAAVVWAEPSVTGTDLDQGDGTEENPYKTLQAAMDAATKDFTVIYAKPGEYKYGGVEVYDVTNRVKFASDKNVSIRPAPDADGAVVICGASDSSSVDGCGPGAVRCVYGSEYGSLLNVTLSGGRTRTDARTEKPMSNDDAHTFGAAFYYNSSDSAFQVNDCIITNCVGAKSIFHRGRLRRCRVVDCTATILMNRGIVANSLVTGNRLGSYPNNGATLFQSTFSGNVKKTGASDFVAWYNADDVYNCVMVDPITAIRSKDSPLTAVGNWVWGNTGGTGNLTIYCTHADPKLANQPGGDYRLSNVSPAIGHGMALEQLWASYYNFAGSDLNYGPVLIAADGTLTPGCYQSKLPSVVDLPANAGLVYEGATAGRQVIEPGETLVVTVKGDATASRWTPGFVANGVTNLFAAWPGSGAVDYGYSTQTQTFAALPLTQWYANVTNTSGVANGFTPETGMRTLENLFTTCAVEAGDTVNVLPGVYDQGQMKQVEKAAVWSRAVVPANVTLRATGSAEETLIVGAEAPEELQESSGCGTNAVRCLYLQAGARAEGFTLTGGHTVSRSLKNVTREDDLYGAAAECANTTAIVKDCLITNNVSYRGGVHAGTIVGCRLFENVATDDYAPAVYRCSCYYSIVSRNRGGNAVMYPNVVYGCTLGPDNRYLDGKTRASDLYFFFSSTPSVLVYNSLIYRTANATNYYANCAFSDESENLMSWHIGEGSFITNAAALALDADYRPAKGNPVIDAGSGAYLTQHLPATDCGGVPRILNDGKIDIGAMEYDWRVDYGRLLGRGVTVTDVTSNVVAVAGGVAVPEGGLELSWTRDGRPNRSFAAEVTGAGQLTVLTNGAAYVTLTSAAGARTFNLSGLSDGAFGMSFAFAGEGRATLSGFRSQAGVLIIVR